MRETLTELITQLPAGAAELLGTWVAALLTLAVLSYVFGDNPFFRLAEYLFIGLAAGYAASLAWQHMLWPRIELLLRSPSTYWYYGIFFILGFLLLCRGSRSLSVLGNLPLGVLFGVGAALALGGALSGTLIPQAKASIVSVSPSNYGTGLVGWAYALDAVLLIVGTIAVLVAFHFTAKGQTFLGSVGAGLVHVLGQAGRGLMMIAFGALLAGAVLSFFAVLNSRLMFLLNDWLKLFGDMGF